MNPLDRDAAEMVKRMNALFAVDRQAREDGLTVEARHELRWLKAPGLLAEIRTQAQRLREQVLPKSKLGEAVTYLLGQWERLIAFQDHPVLELSNNLAENSMRPAVLGRRNWIHVGSVDAGPKVAAILSVVETCRRIGVPVREYLMNVLPGLGERPMADIPGLTPARWAAARSV